MTQPEKIRVLVVDDSSLMRKVVTDALTRDPQIEVVGTALDPYIAREKIISLNPDVLTLDIDMPRMDGITFLKILMEHHPMPIVILSSLVRDGSEKAMEALQAGAVDVVAKPDGSNENHDLGPAFIEKIKAAAQAKIFKRDSKNALRKTVITTISDTFHPRQLILLGASTGGPEALNYVISQLPAKMPGICIVQHIPPGFVETFTKRLARSSAAELRTAVEGDIIKPGLILVAPGDVHMHLDWKKDHYVVRLSKGAPVWHQRPSVDVLFNSAADHASEHTIAALFTGMGKDGAEGMRKLKDKGAQTIAQNEESCAVFGMPRAAIEMGAVSKIAPLEVIPEVLFSMAYSKKGLAY
jgi:two-component system chemotaxis response regulator CheB